MPVAILPMGAKKVPVSTLHGWRIATYQNGIECLFDAPTFETEAEAAAFILGADWALGGSEGDE